MDEHAARRLAEALVQGLEALKQSAIEQQPADATSLDAQLVAGEAAVEAMKRVLGSLGSELRPGS